MARRKNVEETFDNNEEVTETETEPTEAEVTEDNTEAADEQQAEFEAAANEAVDQMDTSTGEVPPAAVGHLNTLYRAFDGQKPKAHARAWLDAQMKTALTETKDYLRARAFVMLKDGLSAGSSSGGATRAPADPTKAYVQKVASVSAALSLMEQNVPENVSEDWKEQVNEVLSGINDDLAAYQAFVDSDDEDAEEPTVSPVVRQAFKLANSKIRGGTSRVSGEPRRNVETHLAQVFGDLEVGSFLKINEIAKAKSTEYGDDHPSSGAVTSRLFPKGKEPYSANGIEACEIDGVRGAKKVA